MNIATIGYSQVSINTSVCIDFDCVMVISENDGDLCDVCVNLQNMSESIDNIIQYILQNTNDGNKVCINSVIGRDKNFFDAIECSEDYVNFFCLLFKKLVTLNRKINFLAIGGLDSCVVPIFEGIAFSAEYECSTVISKTLRIDYCNASIPYIDQVWAHKHRTFFVYNNNLFVKNVTFLDHINRNIDHAFKNKGVYVITGGTGGIGRLLARYLVTNYNSKVILIGRKELKDNDIEIIKSLGVSSFIVADVSDYEELEEAFYYIKTHYGTIDAVFHLAGTIKDKLLRNFNIDDTSSVISPKIHGAMNLLKISKEINLGIVCLFSSLSGAIGNIGQSVYSAANAFMDDFCSYIRDRLHCDNWYSINWGAWDSDGMKMRVSSRDVKQMNSDECFSALESVVCHNIGRSLIWEGRNVFNALNDQSLEGNCVHNKKSRDFLKQLKDYIHHVIQKFSGFSTIDFDQSIIDIGIDSVGLINIAVYLESEIRKYHSDYKLSKALLFEYFSVNKLASYFAESLPIEVIEQIVTNFVGASLYEHKIQLQPVLDDAVKAVDCICGDQSSCDQNNYCNDDIAIVGIAGEFPDAANISEFENILLGERCTIKAIPESRWDWRAFYSQDRSDSNKSYCRHGGFMKNVEGFDNSFFRITPSEAIKMDPQERKFLQTAYHALEDSGYFSAIDRRVGVFVSAMFNHYQNLDDETNQLISGSLSSIANRVSFFMNFNGPSLGIDSMCSGSLMALNLGINSIRLGECNVAVVGGVNIMPHPGKYIVLSQSGFLSPTGKCHSFGIGADGYVPGEGVVAIVIKKLSKAITDQDRIYGIIKGIAVNSVGESPGYTVPSVSSQACVLKEALRSSKLKPEDITYIEAHGTGTALGDPIEIEGIKSVYGLSTGNSENSNICWIGSVKCNIGHLESAAGLAGLIKILLQFKNKTIFSNLSSCIENRDLNLQNSRLQIAKTNINSDYCNYAGLSAFGAGGSNVHVIIQNYKSASCSQSCCDRYIIPLSAKTDTALENRIDDLLIFIQNTDYDLYALSYTLCCARQHFDKRVCYYVSSKEELLDAVMKRESVTGKMPHSLVTRYLNNEAVDFSDFFTERSIATAPEYPFDETKYWIDFSHKNKDTQNHAFTILSPCYVNTNIVNDSAVNNEEKVVKVHVNASSICSDGCYVIDKTCGIQKKSKNIFVIDYKNTEEWNKIFKKLKKYSKIVVVLHMPDVDVSSYELICRSCYALAKSLILQSTQIEVIVHAKKKPRNENDKAQYSVYGLFKAIALENAHIKVILLEGDNCSYVGVASSKRQKFLHLSVDNQQIFKQSFKEVKLQPQLSRLKDCGVYLITGGMGAVGLSIAKFLRKKYNAKLVLIGRSSVAEHDVQKAFMNLYDCDCIKYASADITCREHVYNAVKLALESFGTLNGIIHSAGVLNDSLFAEKDEKAFLDTIAVKVCGVENLDVCTKDINLDFFACFSSLASITGSIGQSDYITANYYLDIFARSRNMLVREGSRSGHSLSINWPLWFNHEGTYASLRDYLKESLGLDVLSEDTGGKLFDDIINRIPDDISQVIPLNGDIPLETFLDYAGYGESIVTDTTKVQLRDELLRSVHIDDIQSIVKEVSNNDSHIDSEISFGEIGLTSIMLQELAQKIENRYRLPFPTLILFKYNSISSLTSYLNEKISNIGAVEQNDMYSDNIAQTNVDERIAIIGMSGKMPNASNLDEYWYNLIANKSSITQITRWTDRMYFGGTIMDYDMFDYRFFNISPKEAGLLDPQQRLFIEESYNAILDSGYRPSELTKVGVFAGAQFNDYRNLLKSSDLHHHPFIAIGNSNNMISNRVSYFFNFSGPSQTIDTACSSAIVAIHKAVNSLISQECNYCLAGAVTLMLDPETTDGAKSMGILSPKYRCATFDESADGYVRSEGVGVVLLKRYSDAIADRDSIYGIIESIREGHGGHANSITAPNQDAQVELIVSAYHNDLSKRVSYIETHGTGTKLGDPIEIEALKMAWNRLGCNSKHTVYLGAVKSSVGHLEPASGMASLFKILLSMKHKQIPANLNFYKQNELIDLQGTNFAFVKENTPWDGKSSPLVAGMSCFGFGGSNTHMVLSEYILPRSDYRHTSTPKDNIFTLSAKSKKSLHDMINTLIKYISMFDDTQYSLNDVSYTLNVGRDHFSYRVAVIANNKNDLLSKLKALTKSDLKKVDTTSSKEILVCKSVIDIQQAYLSGINIDWLAIYDHPSYRRLHLPGYIFEKTRCWYEEQANNE